MEAADQEISEACRDVFGGDATKKLHGSGEGKSLSEDCSAVLQAMGRVNEAKAGWECLHDLWVACGGHGNPYWLCESFDGEGQLATRCNALHIYILYISI